jgi:hypothetical protein
MYTTLGMLKTSAAAYPVLASVDFNEDPSPPHNAIMPATVNAGDLLLILMTLGTGGTPNGTPSGWTQLISGNFFGFYKWADGTEDSAPITVGFTASAADPGFTVLRVTGADTARNPSASVNVENNILNPNPPAVTASWGAASNLFIVYMGSSSASTTLGSYPSGYALYQETNGAADTKSFVAAKQSILATDDPGNFAVGGSTVALMRTFTIAVKGT